MAEVPLFPKIVAVIVAELLRHLSRRHSISRPLKLHYCGPRNALTRHDVPLSILHRCR